MNEGNFVSRIPLLVTGDAFLAERNLGLDAVRVTASGINPDASSAPTAVPHGISFDDGDTALLTFVIPQDYAQNIDKCALRLSEVPSAAAADTTDLGITTAQNIWRAGSAVNASTSSAKAEAATSSASALARENVLDLSGRGFQPGDVVQLTLDGNNSSTTEIILNGVSLIYGSVLRAYNSDDNERALGTNSIN